MNSNIIDPHHLVTKLHLKSSRYNNKGDDDPLLSWTNILDGRNKRYTSKQINKLASEISRGSVRSCTQWWLEKDGAYLQRFSENGLSETELQKTALPRKVWRGKAPGRNPSKWKGPGVRQVWETEDRGRAEILEQSHWGSWWYMRAS